MYEKVWNIQTDRLRGDLQSTTPLTRFRLRLTLECNLKCKFCIQRTFKPSDVKPEEELTKNQLLRVIDEAYNMGVKFVEISGNGEPLCNKNAVKVMKELKKKSIFGELTTNGTLLNQEDIEILVDIGWDLVRFSIDGACAETHDNLRGVKGGFELAKNNMQLFKKIKEKKGSEKPQIAINFIVTNKNYNEIPDVLRLLNEVGGKKLWITPMVLQNENARSLMLNKKEEGEFKNVLKKAGNLAKEYEIETNIAQFIETNTKQEKGTPKLPICFMPWSDIVIGEEGQVGPCFAFYFDKINVKNRSLTDIWEDSEFSNLRRELLNGFVPKNCNSCKQWWGPEEAKQIHAVIKNAKRED